VGDDQEGACDGDDIFKESDGEVFADGLREAATELGSSQCAYDCADDACDEASGKRLVRGSKGRSREATGDDANDELGRDLSAGSLGKLVVDEFSYGGNAEQIPRDRMTEEVKASAFKREPPQAGSPAYCCEGHDGTKTGNDSDKECMDEDEHEYLLFRSMV
jgi:hypothetical protein